MRSRTLNGNSLVPRYDFFTRTELVLGAHERSVRCVEWLSERGALATGGWDASLRVWDPRLAPARPALLRPGATSFHVESGCALMLEAVGRTTWLHDHAVGMRGPALSLARPACTLTLGCPFTTTPDVSSTISGSQRPKDGAALSVHRGCLGCNATSAVR